MSSAVKRVLLVNIRAISFTAVVQTGAIDSLSAENCLGWHDPFMAAFAQRTKHGNDQTIKGLR